LAEKLERRQRRKAPQPKIKRNIFQKLLDENLEALPKPVKRLLSQK